MKPDLSEVLRVIQRKEEIAKLYEENDAAIAKMLEEYGEGRFDYDLNKIGGLGSDVQQIAIDSVDNGYRYLKFELTDNIQALKAGKIFKSTSFSPVSFSSRSLKRCPESLK